MNRLFGRSLLLTIFISFQACAQIETKEEENVEVDVTANYEIPAENIYPSSDIIITTHSDWAKKHYPKRIQEFKQNPLQTDDIVFLGNSITEQVEDWGQKVNNAKAKNRGIAGDTTEGVLARLEELIYFKPAKAFILIGINDLFRDDMSAQKVYDNIIRIVRRINTNNPETKIYLHTILPTTTSSLKSKIKQTNSLLIKAEKVESYKLIRLYKEFSNENDTMNMSLSSDGVHLNNNGYEVWIKKIKEYIN